MSPIRLLIRLALLLVVAWFGYQGYLHVTSTLSVDDRLGTVADRWQADGSAQKAAAGGKGGAAASDLAYTQEESNGWLPIDTYSVDGSTLTVTATYPTCAHPPVVTDVRSNRDVVVVIVHESLTWVPSKARLFPPTTCSAKAVATETVVHLTQPLDTRVLVDGTTALSAQRTR